MQHEVRLWGMNRYPLVVRWLHQRVKHINAGVDYAQVLVRSLLKRLAQYFVVSRWYKARAHGFQLQGVPLWT